MLELWSDVILESLQKNPEGTGPDRTGPDRNRSGMKWVKLAQTPAYLVHQGWLQFTSGNGTTLLEVKVLGVRGQ